MGAVAARDDESGDEIHERGRTAEERADNREQRSPDHLLTDGKVGEPVILLAEAHDLVRAAAEDLGEEHARHREGLLGDRADLGLGFLRLHRDLTPDLAGAVRVEDEERRDSE